MPRRMLYAGTVLNGFQILEDLPSENGCAKVRAICPLCGNEFIGKPKTIKSGDCKSCGCYKIQISKQNLKQAQAVEQRKRYANTYVNNFYILEDLPTKDEVSWVNAICPKCMKPFNVRVKDLKSGNTKSCGCSKSHGETKVADILSNNNITYAKEYSFSDLKRKKLLRFDFAVFKDGVLQYLIEYDGIQHYKEYGWNDAEHFKIVKENDSAKNQYCQDHNIPLIRIPYTHYNDLTINDLLLETSSFIV